MAHCSFLRKTSGIRIVGAMRERETHEAARCFHHARLRVIATTYTQATDYKAIMTLAELPNTTVKINYETNHARMHAKSYLFKRDTGFSTAYIGSSNLSNPALTGGLEWNVKVTEKESFDIVKKFSVSFESYWNDDTFETFDPNDEACRKKLQDELSKPMFEKKNQRHLQLEFRPYAYQQEILDNLEAEREVHRNYNNLVVPENIYNWGQMIENVPNNVYN